MFNFLFFLDRTGFGKKVIKFLTFKDCRNLDLEMGMTSKGLMIPLRFLKSYLKVWTSETSF